MVRDPPACPQINPPKRFRCSRVCDIGIGEEAFPERSVPRHAARRTQTPWSILPAFHTQAPRSPLTAALVALAGRQASAETASRRLRVMLGSTGMPGPIVVVKKTFF